MLAVDSRTAVLHGADLFDNGAWWEAHAVWEPVWRAQPIDSAEREALQALIQVAAYHLKASPELRRAGDRLRSRALARLERCISFGRSTLYGLDLARLHRELTEHDLARPPLILHGGIPLDTDSPEVP